MPGELTTPKGLLLLVKGFCLLMIGINLDVIGWILVIFGLDDLGILSIVGGIFFGADEFIDYLDYRTQQAMKSPKEAPEEPTEQEYQEITSEQGGEMRESFKAPERESKNVQTDATKGGSSTTPEKIERVAKNTKGGTGKTTTAGKTGGATGKASGAGKAVAALAEGNAMGVFQYFKNLGIIFIIETIPYLGVIVPSWTIRAAKKIWTLLKR